ncbi:chromatin modification-related protein EAF7-domain-containing protein [Biscogniauxia marginata]|nr:chromatin modification-related protein EAF7-domain-containing protein [Biscogniauxia marginata]
MPPKRKSKAAEVSTPKASATPTRHDDSMDVDTPQASETPRAADTPTTSKPSHPPASEILDNLWTEDQMASLFKAIIRWKPSGVHKHFRMIAISEHLRNHGFDPDVETHTRMPGIWKQLRLFYNMDAIDEGDNAFDYPGEVLEEKYKCFDLPANEFHDQMWARAMAETGDEAVSPAGNDGRDDGGGGSGGRKMRKRKRGGDADGASVAGSSTAKTRRSSTVDDTDQDTTAPSSPASKTARNTRSLKRAAAKAVAHSRERRARTDSDRDDDEEVEDDEEDQEGEDDDEGEGEENSDNENEEAEVGQPNTKHASQA